jgi:acyl-CoA thioester hydrolase
MISKPSHEVQFRVPFGDIDRLGHVNNAKYLTYFETARSELMSRTLEKAAGKWLNVIIARAEVDFRAPALWNDLLAVKVRPIAIGNSSWTYEYEIELREGDRERKKLIAEGKTVQVAFDYQAGRSIPIPNELRVALQKQIEAAQN